MKITFTDNLNVVHTLPKLTPALSAEIDAVAQGQTPDEVFRAQYDMMVKLMGEDSAHKAFDCTGYDDCDVTALALCFSRATHAYQAVIFDDQINSTARTLNKVPLDKIGKVVDLSGKAK